MAHETAEASRKVTAECPPKPFAERTREERDQAWEEFIMEVSAVDMDDAVDELFARARHAFRTPSGADADAA